ncbi:MAG TPA: hypothetical protein VMT88_10575 [Actinomycetes bacterium]|nr:hypothetical protein [Actinomycetes bacterium]
MREVKDTSAAIQSDEPSFERPGAELRNPQRFARAEIRPEPAEWEPYYGVRFGRNARILLSVLLLGPAAFLALGGTILFLWGTNPMVGILFLAMLVPVWPFARMAFRDLWRPSD